MPESDELVPLEELERRAIFRALRETGGDKLAAARLLGIGKTTLAAVGTAVLFSYLVLQTRW